MDDTVNCFITWTTYGTWLPGDRRGWRKIDGGNQPAQPLLEAWCRDQMTEQAVVLNEVQRGKVESVIRKHARIRGWELHAVRARTNHVHVVVTVPVSVKPQTARDQFKANATRVLRDSPDAITNTKVWTRGGDCEVVDGDDNLQRVVLYVNEAQDRMDRGV